MIQENQLDKKTLDFKTICRDCVFAKYNNEYTEQVGCEFNRLEKFPNKKIVKDESTGISYYEITSFCNYCRNHDWSMRLQLTADLKEEVVKENRLRMDFIILENSQNPNWKDNVVKSFSSIAKQTVKPFGIYIVFLLKEEDISDLRIKLNELTKEVDLPPYHIVNVLNSVQNDLQLIDSMINKCKGQYYTVCKSGEELPTNFTETLDSYFNNDLKKVSMIEPLKGITGLCIQRTLHNLVAGSYNEVITDKIKTLASNQGVPQMVKNFKDLCLKKPL